MNKSHKIFLVVLTLPFLFHLANARTSYVSQFLQDLNIISINGASMDTGAGVSSTGTQRMILASDQSAIPVISSTNTATVVISTKVATPNQFNIEATAVSTTLVPENINRVGVECDSDCSNSQRVYLGFGVAATTLGKIIEPCSSWTPPNNLRFTASIEVISNLGTQVVRCIEY